MTPRPSLLSSIARGAPIVVLLAVLIGINVLTREDGHLTLPPRNATDPLYYVQQNPDEDADSGKPAAPASPVTLSAGIERGDTLAKVLADAQVPRADAFAAVEALRKVFNPKDLQAGQEIDLSFQPADDSEASPTFLGFSFEPSMELQVGVARTANGFTATEVKRPLKKELVRAVGTINSSLYSDAVGAGVPPQVIVEAIRALSYDVDFQREIQPNDHFEIAFERFATDDGKTARVGDLMYVHLTLPKKDFKIYRYIPKNGIADYFNEKGESVRKALLRTPVDGARITSPFSKARRHPILGFTRAHKGVDFGVPKGTPIMAAGAGVVVEVGRKGGYGNYIRIRHNTTYSTAYAHMSRFARGIKRGTRVRQGQVIGYVGMTGLATGPHLHYEVLVNNVQVNPLGVKLPTGQKLRGRELADFLRETRKLDAHLASLPPPPPTSSVASTD